jgi:serine/threonine protein phosphatase PrpC
LKQDDYGIIKKAFNNAQNQIIESDYDINFSGSTSVMVFLIGKQIICANLGDSRAILYSGDKVVELSKDHRPELQAEKKRIVCAGGTVEQYKGSVCFNTFRGRWD